MSSCVQAFLTLSAVAAGLPAVALVPWAKPAIDAARPKPKASARILVLLNMGSGLLSRDSERFVATQLRARHQCMKSAEGTNGSIIGCAVWQRQTRVSP